jgi:hypothetical protein
VVPLLHKSATRARVLTIDPSASHLAYTVSEIDQFSGTHIIEDVGIIWVGDWEKGQKFSYMRKCITFLIEECNITSICTESFFVSPRLKTGSSIIPTINNLMHMIIYESGKNITFDEVSPSSWRKVLGIKPVLDAKGKKDFKLPTRQEVEKRLNITFPDEVVSNITGRPRAFPNDIPDALALTLYVSSEYKIKKLAIKPGLVYARYSDKLKEMQ